MWSCRRNSEINNIYALLDYYVSILYVCFLELFSNLYVFFLDLNSLGPDDGPVRTETCSPTANKVYAGHLLVVLDGYINYNWTFTQRYGEHKKFQKGTFHL